MKTNYEDRVLALLRVTVPESGYALPVREFRFSPPRMWRFDMAWPDERVALEVDGGQYMFGGGRHNSDTDREKMNTAAALGWHTLRVSPAMIREAERVLPGDVTFDAVPWRALAVNTRASWLLSLRRCLGHHVPGTPPHG